MRDARGDIEHISGFENPFIGRREFCEQTQIVMRQQRRVRVAQRADLPDAGAACLNAVRLAMTSDRSFAYSFFFPRPLAVGPG